MSATCQTCQARTRIWRMMNCFWNIRLMFVGRFALGFRDPKSPSYHHTSLACLSVEESLHSRLARCCAFVFLSCLFSSVFLGFLGLLFALLAFVE